MAADPPCFLGHSRPHLSPRGGPWPSSRTPGVGLSAPSPEVGPAVSLDVRQTRDPPRTGNRGPGRRARGVVGALVSGPAGRAWLVAFLSRSTESTWPPREVLTYWWICTSC